MASYATDRNQAELRTVFPARVKFVAMNTFSSWEAARCDEHQFRAKIKVSAGAVLELSFFEKHEKWSEQRRNKKIKTLTM